MLLFSVTEMAVTRVSVQDTVDQVSITLGNVLARVNEVIDNQDDLDDDAQLVIKEIRSLQSFFEKWAEGYNDSLRTRDIIARNAANRANMTGGVYNLESFNDFHMWLGLWVWITIMTILVRIQNNNQSILQY